MKKLLLILLIISVGFRVCAQENEINNIVREIAEDYADANDGEVDIEALQNRLEEIAASPYNLNTVTSEELSNLVFLSPMEIENLIKYRQQYGKIYSVYELSAVNDFTPKDIRSLLPFVNAVSADSVSVSISKLLTRGHHKITYVTKFIAEDQAGYNGESRVYEGDKYSQLVKYKYSYADKIAWGFTGEKDPGEKFTFNSSTHGFDFNSAYLRVSEIGVLKMAVIGDYSVKLGQGLMFSNGFSMGKGSMVLNTDRKPDDVKEYTSSTENDFLRGALVKLKFNNIGLCAFASHKNIDASLSDDSTSFLSFKTDGYHRNQSELNKKDAVEETIFGTTLTADIGNLYIGASVVASDYNFTYQPEISLQNMLIQPDDKYINAGFNYKYIFKKMIFFGETAIDKNYKAATLNGVIAQASSFLNLSVVYRYYQKDYTALYSNAFGENSKVKNEEGFYFGCEIIPYKMFKLSGYTDMFSFPWAAYGSNSPSNGKDFLLQTVFSPSRKFTVTLKWKCKEKPQNYSDISQKVSQLATVKQEYVKLNIKYKAVDNITLENLVQWSNYESQTIGEKGFMMYQNVNYSFKKAPVSISARYALFDAPYNARIYAYENDILYSFSAPGYYYKGCRYYIAATWKCTRNINFQCKIGQWNYFDRNVISQGSDSQINCNKKTEIRFLLQCSIY